MTGHGGVTLRAGEGESVWTLGGRFTVKVDGAGGVVGTGAIGRRD